MRESREVVGPEVVRERPMVGAHTLGDVVGWGAIWAGFLSLLGVLTLLSIFGVALGLSTDAGGTAAAIWAGITLLVASFIGGWIAGLTSSLKGGSTGVLHGGLVWAMTILAALVLTAFGVSGLLGTLANLGLGPIPGTAGTPGVPPSMVQFGAWGTLIALLLSLVAAVLGGAMGSARTWSHEHTID